MQINFKKVTRLMSRFQKWTRSGVIVSNRGLEIFSGLYIYLSGGLSVKIECIDNFHEIEELVKALYCI